MIDLSEATRARIRATFPEGEWGEVALVLRERCADNLPFVDPAWITLVERIRFAVLKLAAGDRAALERHLEAAARDWRDVLVAAGFARDVTAHLLWMPEGPPAI